MTQKNVELLYYYVKMYFLIFYKYTSYSNHFKIFKNPLSNAKTFVALHEKFHSHYLFISNFFNHNRLGIYIVVQIHSKFSTLKLNLSINTIKN
jgi:hypothetical protein